MADTKLVLKNQKVVFFSPKGEENEYGKFAPSITIELDEASKKAITDWWVGNKINNCEPKFRPFTDKEGNTTDQFSLKLGENIQYAGVNGLTKDDIKGEDKKPSGAVIDLIANAFPYNRMGNKGISHRVSAIVVKSAGRTFGADEDLAELLGDAGTTEEPVDMESIPF